MTQPETRFVAESSAPTDRPRRVRLDGQEVQVTEVFRAFWYLAAERQAMFMRRVRALPPPWTSDSILSRHRFTNAYRASDRVSQYLLQRVIYNEEWDGPDTVLRVLLFKIFNRIDTWEHLVAAVGEPNVSNFDPAVYERVLDERFEADRRLYSAAYIMPSPRLGNDRKHADHLQLLDELVASAVPDGLLRSTSLEELFHRLLAIPSFGPFLAFQYAVDLNYSPHFGFEEMDFVVPGPGALRGIAKCFIDSGGMSPTEIIRAVTIEAPRFLGGGVVEFEDLWGRPLQLIDCQNLFCEVDKYARVAYPHIGGGEQSRIKQTYTPDPEPLTLGYPPKWELPWSASEPRTLSTVGDVESPGYAADSNLSVRRYRSPTAVPAPASRSWRQTL